MVKRVFHFVSTHSLGGLENMVINISTLVKGYNYTYVSPNGSINNILNKYNINHLSIPNMNPISVRYIIDKYKPNIVQGHDVKASLALACNYHYCHKHHITVISQLHNDDPRMKKALNLRSFLYALSSYFYDHIVVVSKSIINHYYYRNLIKSKTSVIYNVINPLIIKKGIINCNKNRIWDCIFLGRIVNQKNPLKFIKIINKIRLYIPHIKVVVVGSGPLLSSMKQLSNNYHLNNNIQFVGFQVDPYKFLKDSKVLITPSKYEGFGLVALESLMVGTPVVASLTGGLKDIVTERCGNFASSIDDFSYKVIKLLNNKKLWVNKSYNAMRQSKIVNNISKFDKGYRRIYQ